jgi:PAS domain S-box-containing protein
MKIYLENIRQVLIADDNPDDVASMRDILGAAEHDIVPSITIVRSVAEADEWLKTCKPDVVLLDLELPDSNGLEGLTRLQKTAPHVPVVVLTCQKDSRLALSAVQMGAQDYLAKDRIYSELLIRTLAHSVERKRATDALARERETAQRYLDIAGVMMVGISADGTINLLNKKASAILECRQEDAIGKNWFDTFLPEGFREPVKSVSLDLLDGRLETAEYYENPVLTATGKVRLIAWHNTIIRGESGEIIGHISSGLDITDARMAERALQESEDNFRQALITCADAHVVVDQGGIVVFANASAETFFGQMAGRLVGQKFGFPLQMGKPVEIEIAQGGQPVCIAEMRITEIVWAKATAYLASLRDVTERKQDEAQREKLIIELQDSLTQVRTLRGLLPICAMCKKIKDNDGYWHHIEKYLQENTLVGFTHSYCPECAGKAMAGMQKNTALQNNSPQGKGAGVLIVDDGKGVRDLIQKLLVRQYPDAQVDVAVNGQEAVDLFKRHRHRLIFMDIRMPVMGGEEAFFEIQKFCEIEGCEMPCVIFVTGFAPPEAIEKIVSRDQRHCLLYKPAGVSEILDALRPRLGEGRHSWL